MAELPVAAATVKARYVTGLSDSQRLALENSAEGRIYAALQKYGSSILRGLTADNVQVLLARLDDPRYAGPLRDELIAILQDTAQLGAEHGANVASMAIYGAYGAVDWTGASVSAARWAREYGYNLIRGINDTTRQRVADEVVYFVDNSISVHDLKQRLMDSQLFSETRARAIAVTETTRAYAQGNIETWKTQEYVKGLEWQTASDDAVCPICASLNGRIVRKGELFAGRYNAPPAHVNCRCGVAPVVALDDATQRMF